MTAATGVGSARAVTMWDFSWLLRRQGREAEYADVDRVLDELADRGYDTVRIDAFPHWIAADADGSVVERFTAGTQAAAFMWGNHEQVVVEPRRALAEFMTGLQRRGLHAALSTWMTPDVTGRSDRVRTPDDLARVWIETLAFLRDAGVESIVDYVDLANEWPMFTPGPQHEIWPDGVSGDVWAGTSWTEAEIGRIDRFGRSLELVKAAVPHLPVLFSFTTRGAVRPTSDDPMRLSTERFDLAELHLWLSQTERFARATGVLKATGSPAGRHERLVAEHYWAERDGWLRDLDEHMDRWKRWADDRGLPVWTTECWSSVFWTPASDSTDEWSYVRDVAEDAVPRAAELGWSGIATSNFSQPHHRGMWADAAWHRRMTDIVHAGRPSQEALHG